jgi:hypothetical protein
MRGKDYFVHASESGGERPDAGSLRRIEMYDVRILAPEDPEEFKKTFYIRDKRNIALERTYRVCRDAGFLEFKSEEAWLSERDINLKFGTGERRCEVKDVPLGAAPV